MFLIQNMRFLLLSSGKIFLRCLNSKNNETKDSKVFAEILNRPREGKHTTDNILKLKKS